jgi:hypothetical protein
MNTPIMIVIGIFAIIVLFGIIKKIVKAFIGIAIIAVIIFCGIYITNTYPNEVADITNTVRQVFDNTTVKDYLRVDSNDKYYVYIETKDSSGKTINPTGRIFDYPDADINLTNIIDIANGEFKGLKKQYYKIDKTGNPIVPSGVKAPRKFLQPKISK